MTTQEIINKEVEAIKNLPLDNPYDQVVDLIIDTVYNKKSRVCFSGIGKAGTIAELEADTFSSIGIDSFFIDCVKAAHGDLGRITENTLLVVISNSGKTNELIQLIDLVINKQPNIQIVCITNNPQSPIPKKSDFVLNGNCKTEVGNGLTPTLSNITFITIFNILITFLIGKTNFTTYEYSLNHFGGYIGKKSNSSIEYLHNTINYDKSLKPLYGIYSIENMINKKVYIGQSNNIIKRLKTHALKLKKNKHFNIYLQNSVNKYGIENFKFKVLQTINKNDDKDRVDLNLLENQYIKRFKKFKNNVYNLTNGGDYENNKQCTKVIVYKDTGDFYKQFNSIEDCINDNLLIKYDITHSNIANAFNRNSSKSKGFIFMRYQENFPLKIKPKKDFNQINSRKILCYDINGNYITSYKSLAEASRNLNISKSDISRCISNKIRQIKNYTFRDYTLDYPKKIIIRESLNKANSVKIICYNLKGNYIQTFKSLWVAAKQLDITTSGIRNVLKNKNFRVGNYMFRYYKKDSPIKITSYKNLKNKNTKDNY